MGVFLQCVFEEGVAHHGVGGLQAGRCGCDPREARAEVGPGGPMAYQRDRDLLGPHGGPQGVTVVATIGLVAKPDAKAQHVVWRVVRLLADGHQAALLVENGDQVGGLWRICRQHLGVDFPAQEGRQSGVCVQGVCRDVDAPDGEAKLDALGGGAHFHRVAQVAVNRAHVDCLLNER